MVVVADRHRGSLWLSLWRPGRRHRVEAPLAGPLGAGQAQYPGYSSTPKAVAVVVAVTATATATVTGTTGGCQSPRLGHEATALSSLAVLMQLMQAH